jgi:predicted RNA-binding protein with TRAM domain
MLKLWETLTIAIHVEKRRELTISPRKRSPRNAKNKRGRGNCPVTVGEECEVDISQMSPRGEGIASFKGFKVFIRNVKLGDHVKVRITNMDSVSADAEVVNGA